MMVAVGTFVLPCQAFRLAVHFAAASGDSKIMHVAQGSSDERLGDCWEAMLGELLAHRPGRSWAAWEDLAFARWSNHRSQILDGGMDGFSATPLRVGATTSLRGEGRGERVGGERGMPSWVSSLGPSPLGLSPAGMCA